MGRDRFKEILKDLKERYFYGNSEEIMEELAVCRGPVEELIDLTLEFMRSFAEKKRQKNLVDFSDMEHFALEILVKRGGGRQSSVHGGGPRNFPTGLRKSSSTNTRTAIWCRRRFLPVCPGSAGGFTTFSWWEM